MKAANCEVSLFIFQKLFYNVLLGNLGLTRGDEPKGGDSRGGRAKGLDFSTGRWIFYWLGQAFRPSFEKPLPKGFKMDRYLGVLIECYRLQRGLHMVP